MLNPRTVVFGLVVLVGLFLTRASWMPAHEMTEDQRVRVVASEPRQTELRNAEEFQWQRRKSVVTFKPLFDYHMLARVMSVKRYGTDDGARYSPVDVLATWGPVADPAYDRFFTWSQSARFGFYEYESLPPGIDATMLRTMSANTHLIPADDGMGRQIKRIHRGDVIEVWGQLVKLTEKWENGRFFVWKSSTSRNDDGNGACEVLLVEDLVINGP